jgi:ATP-dependent RNA helicase DDX43
LAFLLPALIHIEGQTTPRSQRSGPTALIIAPTRELVQQIEGEVKKYSYKGIKSSAVYGGTQRRGQAQSLVDEGVEIIIATPGRLCDLVFSTGGRDAKLDITNVSYLVLDEADRMLDLGYVYYFFVCFLFVHNSWFLQPNTRDMIHMKN